MPDERFGLQLDLGDSSARAREVDAALQTVRVTTTQVAEAAEGLRGEKRIDGRGLLGASYAFQDFVSVMSMGGGFDRALMSITNNFDMVAKAAGATAAQAGAMSLAFTAFAAGLPLIEKAAKATWDAISGLGAGDAVSRAMDAANERLGSMKDKAEGIAKAFERMATAPTGREGKAAKGLEQLITEAPTEAIVRAITAAIGPTEFGAQIDPNLRDQIENVRQFAEQAIMPEARDRANQELNALMQQARRGQLAANRATAQRLLGEAVQPGGAGAEARNRILDLARRAPGAFPQGFAADMEAASPEGIRRQEQFERQSEVNKQVQERIRRDTEENNRRLEQRSRDLARGPAEQERQRLEANRRAEQLNRAGDAAKAEGERERLRQIQESQRDNRAISAEFARQRNRQFPVGAGGHLPVIPPNAAPEETARIILDTQMRMQANAEADRMALRQMARRVNQRVRNAGTAGIP